MCLGSLNFDILHNSLKRILTVPLEVAQRTLKAPAVFVLSTVEGFVIFENFLTNLIVKIKKLYVCSKQFIIDQFLPMCKECFPICKKRNIE